MKLKTKINQQTSEDQICGVDKKEKAPRNAPKFTFKKYPVPSGLASVGFAHGADIKLKKKTCGFYQESRYSRNFHVWFAIKEKQGNCDWKNIRLKVEFKNEEECRKWIQEHTSQIIQTLNLHFYEE